MRLYLFDKLTCPRCGAFPLLKEIKEEREGAEIILSSSPCTSFCSFKDLWLSDLGSSPPCGECLIRKVWSGNIICPKCNAIFPVSDGIPNFMEGEAVNAWVAEEQSWWNRRYSRMRAEGPFMKFGDKLEGEIPGNRYYERNYYLFKPLRQVGLTGKLTVEIGAGSSQYVANLLPPSSEKYFYIGTDVSRDALLIGSTMIPEGDFLQCTAGNIPFRSEAVDFLLSFGVLHHIPEWQMTVDRLLKIITPVGLFLFDESIEKPRIFGKFHKHSLTSSLDSPHEGKISSNELLEILKRNGSLLKLHFKTTPLRFLLTVLLSSLIERSLFVTKVVLFLDQLFLKTAGKAFKSLGAAEALGILKKE